MRDREPDPVRTDETRSGAPAPGARPSCARARAAGAAKAARPNPINRSTRSDSRCVPAPPGRPRRRAASCRPQDRPTSAARRSPRRGAGFVARRPPGRAARSRRRLADDRRHRDALAQQRRGNTRRHEPQAVVLIALRSRTGGQYTVDRAALRPPARALRRGGLRRARRRPGCPDPPRGAIGHRARSAWSGSSIASGRPSSVEVPLTTRPLPRQSTPW